MQSLLQMGQVISEKISTTVMTTAHLTRRVRKAKKVQMVDLTPNMNQYKR
jgi:hypothetical protein